MAEERQSRGSGRLGAFEWGQGDSPYASLLDALARDRLELTKTETELDATSRRGMADVLEAEQRAERAERDERAEAQRELSAFRAAIEDASTWGDVEVGYDGRNRVENTRADVLIQYLVRTGYAEVRTEEPEPGAYVYFIRVDWPRLRALAQAAGRPLPV